MSNMRARGGGPRGMGPGGMMMGAPGQRSKDPRSAANKLIRRLRPELVLVIASIIFTGFSVTLNVIGPKVLGNATNVIFGGIIGRQLPPNLTQAQAVAYLRAHGQGMQASLVAGATDVNPGHGIDFTRL
ncbi:MAG: ABC transporter ATP-binding protein, partial [Candidatus Dormibacteraeota bacterium]|nr:ABC transporter ATP-binding protein [Candidatus Dormibacteraeota bacterium]